MAPLLGNPEPSVVLQQFQDFSNLQGRLPGRTCSRAHRPRRRDVRPSRTEARADVTMCSTTQPRPKLTSLSLPGPRSFPSQVFLGMARLDLLDLVDSKLVAAIPVEVARVDLPKKALRGPLAVMHGTDQSAATQKLPPRSAIQDHALGDRKARLRLDDSKRSRGNALVADTGDEKEGHRLSNSLLNGRPRRARYPGSRGCPPRLRRCAPGTSAPGPSG